MAKLIEITGKALAGEWGTDDETGSGIPVLRTTNFTNEGVVDYTDVVTRTITKKNIEEKYLRPGDIIIEKSGGSDKYPVGRVIYYDGPENTYLFNNFTGLLRVQNQEKWHPKYVFYSLYGNYRRGGTRPFENKTTGLHNLKTDDYVSRYEVKDADYLHQKEICVHLDKLYSIVKMREKELVKLDELIKARFVEMFGDPVNNSKSFVKEELGNVCTKITDGTHDTPERYSEGFLLITGKNIRASGIIYDDVEYVSEEDHKVIYARCNPEYEDVLYTNIGVNYGTACLNDLQYEFSMKNVALLKPDRSRINGYYLWICLNLMRDFILRMNQVGGAQTFMGLATIKKIVIPIPPIELQNRFIDFIKQVDNTKKRVKEAQEETQTLFDSLMQKYFG